MALDVYYVADVRHAIVGALVIAIETAAASEQPNRAHVGGVVTMAKGTAALFGIPWPAIARDAQQALGGDLGNLLRIEAGV